MSVCLLTGTTDRPHRHTTLITYKLARYKINIAALSETRLSSGYSFFWSGHAPDDKCGVGYAIKTSLVGRLACPPKGVNDRHFHFITWKSSLPSSVPMHPLWPTQMRQKTSSMKTLNMLSQLFLLQTSSSFLVTLMLELDKTASPGKKYWVNMGPENVTVTAYCFFRPVLSIIF